MAEAMTVPPPPPDSSSDAELPEQEPLGAGIDWADPNSPLAPYYLGVPHLLGVLVVGLITLFYANVFPLEHTDIWAHTAYGRWIAEHHQLPDREPLSPFTDESLRGAYYPWLTQVAYYVVYSAGAQAAGADPVRQIEGGVAGLLTLHLLLLAATFAFWLVAFTRASGSVWVGIGGVGLVFVALGFPLAVQRPQLVGVAAFAAIMAAVTRYGPSRRALVWVPLLIVLWANAHGSFLMGLVLLGFALAGRVFDVFAAEGLRAILVLRDTAAKRILLMLICGTVAAGLATPYGPALYPKVLAFGAQANLATMGEWQPLDFSIAAGGHRLFLAALVFLIVTQLVSPIRIHTGPLLAVLALGAWSLAQQRMMVWWVPVVVWAAMPCWRAALAGWGVPFGPPALNFRYTIVVVVFVLGATFNLPLLSWAVGGSLRSLNRSVTPATTWAPALTLTHNHTTPRTKALGDALAKYPDGRFTGRVFASEMAGDYLVWALPSEWPVLLFTHAHLFPAGHWGDGMQVKSGGPGWWELLDRHRVNLVIVETELHPALIANLRADPRWKVVLDEDNSTTIPDPRQRLFIAIREVPLREGSR